jgi:hypothetical protein
MTDIKDLLAKAIGDDEPPVGIDRDEVFRAGRQRVRRRRALAAGGVVAAVVAAVVGAAVLTDFVEVRPDDVPAAGAPPAPPGPELPLPLTTTAAPRALTDEHANDLTQKLYKSGLVDIGTARPWPGQPGPHPRFRAADGEYLYEGDVESKGRKGQLQVTVGFAPSGAASCDNLGEKYDSCAIAPVDGQQVVQATWQGGKGERRNLAVAVLPDGTKVAAVATNLLRSDKDQGKVAAGEVTVLDMAELTKLITKSGFSV